MTEIQDTSKEAYESVNRCNDTLYLRVLNSLRNNPSTCDEIEVRLEGRHQSVSSRVRHGVKSGRVRNSGAKRRTRTGRRAIVWELIQPDPSTSTLIGPSGSSPSADEVGGSTSLR